MRRFPRFREITKLKKLTDARELAAMVELTAIEAERKAAEIDLLALQNQNHNAKSIDELVIVEKWSLWREDEMRRRATVLAAVTAKHKIAAMRCGRLIAESSVLKEIGSQARAHEAKQRQKRST
mgnify:CR=1 FL=1